MQQAVPISAWQPASAPLIEAFFLTTLPTIPPAARAFAISKSVNPLCYNGNVYSVDDYIKIKGKYKLEGVMIGRGAIINPAIFREINGGARLSTKEVVEFTEALAYNYNNVLKSETFTLHKLKEIWVYMAENYKDNKKITKSIKKANKI